MRGDLGRIHVSVGVAIDHPNLILEASPTSEIIAKGPRADRIKKFAKTIIDDSGIEGGVKFNLVSDIPEHAGFGSGTQLALAVGTAVSELYKLELEVQEIASKLCRSRVSGVGTHAFKEGGFIVDGGHRTDKLEEIPPLIHRSNVPEDWIFVVGVPEINPGLSGMKENKAFKRMEPPPAEFIGEVSRIVLVKMIPSIIEHDIKAFGETITELDSKFGMNWIEVQGGKYGHPIIEEGVEFLLDSGAHGAGQSSWGPAFYGLVDGKTNAFKIAEKLRSFLSSKGIKGRVFYTEPNNQGAVIKVVT